jgi:predicted Zn-dependent protease
MALKGDKLNDQNKAAIDQANALIPGLILNGYGRDQELEADGQGLQSMIKAGYDPAGAVAVFQTFQKMEPEVKGIQIFMQSHPTAKTRIADLQAQINNQFPGTIGTGDRYADRYQEMVKGTLAKDISAGDTVISPVLIAGGVLTAAAILTLVLTL